MPSDPPNNGRLPLRLYSSLNPAFTNKSSNPSLVPTCAPSGPSLKRTSPRELSTDAFFLIQSKISAGAVGGLPEKNTLSILTPDRAGNTRLHINTPQISRPCCGIRSDGSFKPRQNMTTYAWITGILRFQMLIKCVCGIANN